MMQIAFLGHVLAFNLQLIELMHVFTIKEANLRLTHRKTLSFNETCQFAPFRRPFWTPS